MSTQNQLDILSCVNINQECINNLTKDNINSFDRETKKKCRILKFDSNWSFQDVIVKISSLDIKNYPLLFIFIIDIKSDDFSGSVNFAKSSLSNLNINRLVILQLTSGNKNSTRIYYNDEKCQDFSEINEESSNLEEVSDFASFIWLYLNGKIHNFEDVMLEKLPKIKNSSLILKFLKTLKLTDDFCDDLVLECAKYGSESDLLAFMDAQYDDNGNINGYDLEYFLSSEFNSTSILYTAVQSSNQKIINFLLQKCSFWIQQLPFDHQLEISSIAYTSGQLSVFCDLLDSNDFPFPKDFDPEPIIDKRLLTLICDRVEFHSDVLEQNRQKIRKFIEANPKLKFVFTIDNKSAMSLALQEKKYESFEFLKANRFRDNEIENINIANLADDEDKKVARKFAFVQIRKNVNISTYDDDLSVLILATKSLIYSRDVINLKEQEQREIIRKWFREIYRTTFGYKLIDAVIQCKDLKIIFDFDCFSTKNVDVLSTSGSLGSTYSINKWIFIAAKLDSTKYREQKIKGVIAHEICHYVMRLVYQNKDYPYYADNKERCAEFEDIANEIKSMLFPKHKQEVVNEQDNNEEEQSEESDEENDDNSDNNEEEKERIDDKCDGIISTVYTLYDEEARHPELIVRPAHIQAQFDDNEDKLNELEEFYQKLFKFFQDVVLPEIQKFSLQSRGNIQCFNDYIGILCELKDSKIKLPPKAEINELISKNSTILTTNVPKLLLLDIYNQLNDKYKDLSDVKNIFITPQNLEKSSISKKFDNILKEKTSLNIFFDCTNGFGTNLDVNLGDDTKVFFVTFNGQQCEELVSKITKKAPSEATMTINYNWMDLTADSQKLLLQTKINFQNNYNFSLSELISNEVDTQQAELIINEDFSDIINDQLLNMLLEKSEIKVNQLDQENIEDKKFRILFQTRNLIKKFKVTENLKKIGKFVENDSQVDNMQNVANNETDKDTQQEHVGSNESEVKNEHSMLIKSSYENDLTQLKEIEKTEQMTQQQMLDDVKNKKFVLISDKAGSGKSWILKNIENKLLQKYPNRWLTYVDLKQFIQELNEQNADLKFELFMINKIIKPRSKYEAKIFKKLYKNGKVFIMFDGFDEISPNCADFVTKLFQSFEHNGGNQIWIATRDYFEVNLKKELKIDEVYKLDEFTEEHGIESIASSWILSELELIANNNLNLIRTSPKLQDYKNKANIIIEKIPKTENDSIGLPQFYKMIADITKNNKDLAIDFTLFKLFEECVNMEYERWSQQKGKLRSRANTESQDKELNYQKLHQLIALKSLFPKDSRFCDLNIEDLLAWIDEEIIACGMLTKIGEIFLFSHETYREYFVAKFILRILMMTKKSDDDQIYGYLIQILTVEKFGIIRMFLNEALAEKSTLIKIEKKIPKIIENFYKNVDEVENLGQVFEENLENFADLILKIFKNGNYEKMKKIVLKNKDILSASTVDRILFVKVQGFVSNYFEGNDFKDFMSSNEIFLEIFISSLDAESIKKFLEAIKTKTDVNFIRESLKMKKCGENLFFYLIHPKNFSSDSFQQVIRIFKTYFNVNEVIDLIKEYDNNGWNVLHLCVIYNNAEILETLWNSLELLCKSENILDEFKSLITQDSSKYRTNILHLSTHCDKIEFHETLWKLLLNTFENREELKDLIMQRDNYEDSFVHYLVDCNNPEILNFVITKIKENFTVAQYEEILKSKGNHGIDFLHAAVCSSKDIKTLQILWNIFRDFYKSNEEFLEFLKEVDTDGDHVFHLAACFASKGIFEFMINELENITSVEEIRIILNSLGMQNKNILQSAARLNKSVELHEFLWITIKKYFNSKEVLDMIQHVNKFGNILIFNLVANSNANVVEFYFKKLKEFLDNDQYEEILKAKGFNGINSLQTAVCSSKDIKTLQILWNIFRDFYKSNEEFLEFLKEVDIDGNHVFHLAACFASKEVFEFMINELEKITSVEEIRNILKSLGMQAENILQSAAMQNESIEFHEFLWITIKKFFNSKEVLDMIQHVNEFDNNLIFNLVANSNADMVEFYFKKLKEFLDNDQYKGILKTKELANKNLLQYAAFCNESLEVHKFLWKNYRECFNDSEMFDIIKHNDKFGNNLLIEAIKKNKKEIVEFIWNQIKNILVPGDYFSQKLLDQLKECEEHLMLILENPSDKQKLETMKVKWNKVVKEFEPIDSLKQMEQIINTELSFKDVKSLHRLAFCDKLEYHEALWKILLKNFDSKDNLLKLILCRDIEDNNFLHFAVSNDNPEIIVFTLTTLNANFTDDQFREILQSKDELGRNLLQIAAKNSKNIKINELLWKFYQNCYKLSDEFLENIKQVDNNGSNVLHLAASSSTAEILDFIIKTIENILSKNETKSLLATLGYCKENILHAATGRNKSLDLHKKLWEIIQKHFNPSEILKMINYCDRDGDHILHNAIFWNTLEIVEFTWTQIKNFIQTKEDQTEYLNRKGHRSHNLLQMSEENQSKDPEVRIWVKKVMDEYKITFDDGEGKH